MTHLTNRTHLIGNFLNNCIYSNYTSNMNKLVFIFLLNYLLITYLNLMTKVKKYMVK